MTHRLEQLTLRLVGEDDLDTALFEREFPTIVLGRGGAAAPAEIVVDDHSWYGAFDLGSFDEAVEDAGPNVAIAVRGYDVVHLAVEVATRYQRYLDRRNDASRGAAFDGVLSAHAALYDVGQPAIRFELDHALDTWQWVLRLAPRAGLAIQLAALFHDLERLAAADRQRIEHRVPDGQWPKDGSRAERMVAALVAAGVPLADAERARAIVYCAERRGGDPDVLLLDDADTLSFMSLCSALYSDYFGVAQTRRKVAYMVARLGPSARERLEHVRLRPDVDRLLRELAA
jgi:hypothetical protein